MPHTKSSNVIFPNYSFAVRHPVYNEYTVVADVRAFVEDYSKLFASSFVAGQTDQEPIRTCISVYHNKTDMPFILAMTGEMANEYHSLKSRNCHNLVLVHHAGGHSFAIGNVEIPKWK